MNEKLNYPKDEGQSMDDLDMIGGSRKMDERPLYGGFSRQN